MLLDEACEEKRSEELSRIRAQVAIRTVSSAYQLRGYLGEYAICS